MRSRRLGRGGLRRFDRLTLFLTSRGGGFALGFGSRELPVNCCGDRLGFFTRTTRLARRCCGFRRPAADFVLTRLAAYYAPHNKQDDNHHCGDNADNQIRIHGSSLKTATDSGRNTTYVALLQPSRRLIGLLAQTLPLSRPTYRTGEDAGIGKSATNA